MKKTASLIIFLLVWVWGCETPQESKKPLLLTSIAPVAELVRQVAGEDFRVETLIHPGQSAHEFAPMPQDMVLVSDAALYFEIGIPGLEAETLMGELLKTRPNLPRISVASGLELLESRHSHEAEEEESHQDEAHEKHHELHPGETFKDPHVWLSVKNMLKMTETVKNALIQAYPEKSQEFSKRAETYTGKLFALHEEIQHQLETIRGQGFMEFHPAWAYFTRDYGLVLVNSVQKHGGHEDSLSLDEIREVMKQAKKSQAKAVAAEPQFNPETAAQIAKEFGIPLVLMDTLESLAPHESYLEKMRINVKNLLSAFNR